MVGTAKFFFIGKLTDTHGHTETQTRGSSQSLARAAYGAGGGRAHACGCDFNRDTFHIIFLEKAESTVLNADE